MGHKVHPKIYRMPILFPWDSRWVSTKQDYAKNVRQDVKIRLYILKKFKEAAIDSVLFERGAKNLTITIFAGKPGVIIGRGGQGLDGVRKEIERNFLNMALKVKLNIQEVKSPSLSARIVAESVVKDTEARMAYRRVIKQHIERVMKAGAQGVKIGMAGRLNGVEIARAEKLSQGKIPLITLRSNVDYAKTTAHTMYGTIGVKVWIYKGESFSKVDKLNDSAPVSEKKVNTK